MARAIPRCEGGRPWKLETGLYAASPLRRQKRSEIQNRERELALMTGAEETRHSSAWSAGKEGTLITYTWLTRTVERQTFEKHLF